MKIRIHGEWPDGTEDSLVIEEDTIEEIRVAAARETEARDWDNCWSEEA